MTDPNPHGCTIGGQPAMPVLISEYNQLTADLAASVAAGEQQKRRAEQAEEMNQRLLQQRQEMAEERYAWQERGDRAEADRDRLKAAILDIDAHATPIGIANPNDPDGNPHHYAVTVGALHRALGKVGHTAAPCTAEAVVDRVRTLHTRVLRMEALVCAHCGTAWPCPTTQALDQPVPTAAPTAELETAARVFSALHRSAEADVTRIIDLYERWVKAGPPPLGTSISRWWDARLAELHNAIRPPADQTATEATEEQR